MLDGMKETDMVVVGKDGLTWTVMEWGGRKMCLLLEVFVERLEKGYHRVEGPLT